jgi:hypothetical protein
LRYPSYFDSWEAKLKTLFAVVLTAAAVSTAFIATNITRTVEKGVQEREAYVTECERYNEEQHSGVHVSATGFLADTIAWDFDTRISDAERDYLIAETLHGTESVEDYNFREALRRMKFTHMRVGNRTVDIPKSEPSNSPSGSLEFDFVPVA